MGRNVGVVVIGVVLAACGGGGATDSDGSVSSDGPPTGPVTVVVTRASQPLAGIRVVFQREDSVLIAAVDTDASGMAQSDVPPEGAAWVSTVMTQPSDGPLIQTIGGVKPGDTLRIAAPPDQPPLLALTMSLPKDSGASSYSVWSSCDENADGVSDAQTAAFSFVARCAPPIDFVVVSNTGNFLHVTGQTPVADRIDLIGTYAPMQTITGTYTNVPDNTYWLWVQYKLAPRGKRLFTADTLIEQFSNQTGSAPLLRVPTVPVPLIADETTANALRSDRHHRLERVDAPGATREVDVADLVYGFTSTPAYSANAGITWQPGLAAGMDTVLCYFEHSRAVGNTTERWGHIVVEPHTPGRLVLPTLPIEAFDYNIALGDVISVVRTVQIRSANGNDALRGRLLSADDPYDVIYDLEPGERRDYISIE